MTQDRIDLTRRKLLAAAGTVGAAGAGAGLGTSALFSDTESFEGNSITAGTLDMSVTAEVVAADPYWEDQGVLGETATADGDPVVGLQATDVKPGDWAIICFTIDVLENPGCVTVTTENLTSYENGQTEPEAEVDGSAGGSLGEPLDGEGSGELQDELVAEIYGSFTDAGSENPRDYLSGQDSTTPDGTTLAGADDTYSTGVTVGSGTAFNSRQFYLLLELPAGVGNSVQSDAVEWDLRFDAVQARHNPDCSLSGTDPTCECPSTDVDTAASQSPEVAVQSTDASSFPQVSTFLSIDTTAGNNDDLTVDDFALAEAGCGQDISVDFTSEDKPVDFVFLMDVTSSMSAELGSVKDNIDNFVTDVEAEGIDAQYALYLVGDEEDTGEPSVFLKQALTGDSGTFTTAVNNTSLEEEVGYGGDGPEDNYEAILTADNELSYRSGAQRVMIDITDAPGEEDIGEFIGGLEQTRANAVSVLDDYTYIAVSPDLSGEDQKRQVAADVGGTHITLGENFDPILTTIEEEVSTSYRVRYTTACPERDGSTRDIVVAIDDPNEGTLYATTSYTAPS